MTSKFSMFRYWFQHTDWATVIPVVVIFIVVAYSAMG